MGRMEDAVAHHRAGRLQEAAAGYVEVLRSDPDHADALHLLGLVMHRLGHGEEALGLMDRALAVDRRMAPAHANRALVLQALDRPEEAAASARRALRLRPGFYEALLTLARVSLALDDLDGAARAARDALQARPGAAAAAEVLALRGRVLLARSEPETATRSLAEALVAAPSRPLAIALCDAASQLTDPPDDLEDALACALAQEGVDHQRLERMLRATLAPARDDPAALAIHPLTPAWLGRTLVLHPEWETATRRLRRWLLEHLDEAPLETVVALALHGFHVEHAWPPDPDEEARLAELDADDPRHAAAAAMYGPLPDVWAERDAPEALQPLIRSSLLDAAEEAGLLDEIEVLGGVSDDAVSTAVARMYEQNPYPRLVSVHVREPVPLTEALAPWVARLPPIPERPLRVLVAGCGTGHHPLQSATAWQEVEVLGVDLSRRSLARAARRARDLGVDNVRFAQGDVLALDQHLEPGFDVVESVGVLHHLDDPVRGFRVLRGLVRPGGLMRIGLYAERGRADVIAGRALVEELGLEPTPQGLRAFREHVRGLPEDHPARPLVWSPDFASLSGVRDLVFHVCEHRFTLPQLGTILDELDLRLLGFQHAVAAVPALYRERWPDDEAQLELERWDALEAEHPRIFSGMYVMWLSA